MTHDRHLVKGGLTIEQNNIIIHDVTFHDVSNIKSYVLGFLDMFQVNLTSVRTSHEVRTGMHLCSSAKRELSISY